MRFRTLLLLILLLSQPLAAFNLNCAMPVSDAAGSSTVSDEHCVGHASDARGSANGHEQVPDRHPAGHHAAGGSHCQSCASGAFVLPLTTLISVAPHVGTLTLPIPEPAPQFLPRPLFRPPIL